MTDIEDTQVYAESSHILVVDDDAATLLLAEAALGDAGYRVSTASDGDEAIAKVKDETPDLVLLDVVMPGRDGFSTIRELRSSVEGLTLPIIMVTGLEDSSSIERAYRIGATGFTTKPINWVALRHHVQYVLRASRDHQRLAESEARYALAARGANDGLWDWDLQTDRIYFSPRWLEMLNLREGEVGDRLDDWLARIHADDLIMVREQLERHLQGDEEKIEIEYRIRERNGSFRWMLCRGLASKNRNGRHVRMAGWQTDITQRKVAEERLLHDALHDDLTKLPNRALLLDRTAHCINLAQRRSNYLFAVVFIDLDRFKTVNDSLGHLAGDQLLQQVAARLQAGLRDGDTLARIGGDEFTLLFESIQDLAELTRIMDRIQQEIAKAFRLDGENIVVTASMGIALSNSGYAKPEDMLRDADIAMYRAKALGKNRYEIFDKEMHTRVLTMMRTEKELRTALTDHQFRLHYQPIVSLSDNRITGFEALIRWQHPERGLLEPKEFLDVAEETGLIVAMGRWVLQQATRQLAQWRKDKPKLREAYVSVNLSSREFMQAGLVEQIETHLAESGLPPACLKLEVTETVLIESTNRALNVLTRLRKNGIRLSIDDFGTGYSSFNYLHRFPFDVLKIDRAFVHAIDNDSRSFEMVKAMVMLAHNLGLEVIAEGGETQAEIDLLTEIGCEFSQGYAYCEPLAPSTLLAFLDRNENHLQEQSTSTSPALPLRAGGGNHRD